MNKILRPLDRARFLTPSQPLRVIISMKSRFWTQSRLTAEHDITKPITSIPAWAKAVLAAIDPAATHPSIPSVSIIVTKISMVAFGKVSNRTEDMSAW
jgi:hypothetical protein